ncbi:MAG: FmdB family zinc ribbon protein [Planctomycetota bacterium]|jgi:putative FmdB family regulatory protein
MPTYDYVCRACGHEFELFQQISDSVKRKCPECGTLKLERQIGPGAGVIFKGSGFYQTDYRSDSYKKAAQAEKKSASDKKSGSDKAKSAKKDTKASKTKKSH